MQIYLNSLRETGLDHPDLDTVPHPLADGKAAQVLVNKCPRASVTPLVNDKMTADAQGIASVWIKDERTRMGLGSFKALGAAHVIARDAAEGKARGQTYITASAGNHGLSVAAGASAFGAKAVIYLSDTVPEAFADRLRETGAQVVRHGTHYEASMEGAAQAAEESGAILLSDSSWPGYFERPHVLMEGYLILMEEVFQQIPQAPTHIFLQAGVGGLAGAAAAAARAHWGARPVICVVEPEAAPALQASVAAAAPVMAHGPVSAMGRLDCKEPSLIALKGLSRDADAFALITEAEGQAGADWAAAQDMPSTPSGAAGLSGLLHLGADGRAKLGIDAESRILLILSEGPE